MKTTRRILLIIVAVALGLTDDHPLMGQAPLPPPPRPPIRPPIRMNPFPAPAGPPQFGDPLPGLTDAQRAAFGAGKTEFENVETPESGLGPIFNNVSCVSCHSSRATGGASAITVTRFGRRVHGVFDPMDALGGSLLQDHAVDPAVQEVVPPEANVVAHRQATPLFGLGLIEAIPDAEILDAASRDQGDGIHGRAAVILDVVSGQNRVGRFGWKNQQATLLAFAGDAYRNEMGITNRFFPTENAPNGNMALLQEFDPYTDPEDQVDPVSGKSDIDAAADFMQFLAPPPPVPQTRAAAAGRALFQQINCTGCHQPAMNTGPNAIEALSNKPVMLYSDLLLHDMGALGDGIAQAAAGEREFRTAPLWGLRASGPYLHDGRAATIDDAILAHAGEAAVVRKRYKHLTADERQQIVAFLNSL